MNDWRGVIHPGKSSCRTDLQGGVANERLGERWSSEAVDHDVCESVVIGRVEQGVNAVLDASARWKRPAWNVLTAWLSGRVSLEVDHEIRKVIQ
ncbi:MAG: hypothetical protein ACJAV2_002153, partial [Myxococcota bacterium]